MTALRERIRQEYEALTASERRIAAFLIDHLEDLTSYNSVEISQLCQTSKATVSRLIKRLGYSNFRAMRDAMRQLRQQGVPLANRQVTHTSGLIQRHFEQEKENLALWQQALPAHHLHVLTEHLSRARQIGVMGLRNSYPLALHLRQQLQQVRGQVHLLPQPGQTLAEEFLNYSPDDLLIVFGFHRRPSLFPKLIQAIQKQEIPWALCTETGTQLARFKPDYLIELPLDSVSAFDSYALPMSLISLLANQLLHQNLESGRARIHDSNALFDLTDELDLSL
ncbi:MurR/RpiR family transcriptional regulator [Nitrincola tapanii]|uniref:MurR/RpiR family transcriptional regulator n=1 Tax=Nitrincola tapanii TaxID=1708751 RepID=A0A5A9W439_9GAMM|nr:MurR/RpiR family transcriptional regulator [Nitrincola tapanii]KAA0875273.1 MurR/RpiR family transcriptional regulator [Nitrincola tapanii]